MNLEPYEKILIKYCLDYCWHRVSKHRKKIFGVSRGHLDKLRDKFSSILKEYKIEKITLCLCKHHGFWIRFWWFKRFICINCGTLFTRRQIEFYRRFNKQ